MQVVFARERFQDVIDEAVPLLVQHFEETARFKDIPLSPNFEAYKHLDDTGILRIFTARKFGKLVGYCTFFVQPHLHYRESLQAYQTLLFVDPEFRGFGMRFIAWMDDQLKVEGVSLVHQTVTQKLDFSSMLSRLGYEPFENIYIRRLS